MKAIKHHVLKTFKVGATNGKGYDSDGKYWNPYVCVPVFSWSKLYQFSFSLVCEWIQMQCMDAVLQYPSLAEIVWNLVDWINCFMQRKWHQDHWFWFSGFHYASTNEVAGGIMFSGCPSIRPILFLSIS